MSNKQIYVTFCNKKTESSFEELIQGRFHDKQLYEFINRAIQDLKKNPACGIKIPKRLWPKSYIQEFKISNLWKYNLPNAQRLIYTIKEDELMILNIILEWLDHKQYEKRFRY